MRNQSGQSLVEVIIGLAIGSILISAATFAIVVMLRTVSVGERVQLVVIYNQDLLESVRSFAASNWQNVNGLERDTSYYLVASSTEMFAVKGKEGLFEHGTRSGLVGHWKFDEDEGLIAYDFSGNSNHGDLINNPTRATSTCILGGCLDLNGSNNYVNAGDFSGSGISDPSIFGEISFSVWVYRKGPGSGSADYIISSGGQTGSRGIALHHQHGGDALSANVKNGNTRWVVNGLTIQNNTWYHIFATWDGETLSLYINGQLQGEDTGSPGTDSDTQSILTFGRPNNADNYYWEGIIDDIRIYNRALSAEEVINLYNSLDFRRYFMIENVCRSNDGSIIGDPPCEPPLITDPSTLKVKIVAEWDAADGVSESEKISYLVRQKNEVLVQTDWSGGPGATDPQQKPLGDFATSTYVDYTSQKGSIRIDLEAAP